jgi:deoxyribonuclease-4
VDVSSPEALDRALETLDKRIGLERLRALHVNDAAVPLGANRDRHERVGHGVIGDGLATFLSHPAFERLPAVVETWEDEGPETDDVDRLRKLYGKGRRRRRAVSGSRR